MTPDKVEAALGVLGSLLRYAEAQICQHDETRRGGAIWEICDQCGAAWADDRGGKPAFEWPAEIVASHEALSVLTEALAERERDAARLDYIERAFSGMTNRERYLPVKMIWGNGAMGRTLREACDKYMKRDAAMKETP